jgi:hypothetical protein
MVQGAQHWGRNWVCICDLNSLALAVWPSRGSHQVSKRPRENEGTLGGHRNVRVRRRNFCAWIKYFKFKTESNSISSSASSAAQKAKLYFTVFSTPYLVESFFQLVIFLLSKVRNRPDAVKRDEGIISLWLHCNRTFKNLASFHQSQGTRWL